MLKVTYDDVGKLYHFLKDVDGGRALPYAVRDSLNTSAFATRREWESQGKKRMHVRNKWTFKGQFHQVKKARLRKSVNQMEAVSGNKHRYMAKQEKGFRKSRAGGLQIPETQARIGGDKKRIVSTAYWRSKIGKNIGPRYDVDHHKFSQTGPKPRQARYIAGTLRAARARGKRYVFLEFSNRNRGIYDLKRANPKGKGKGGKLKQALIWEMGRKTTRTKRHPMLEPAIEKLTPHYKQYHRMALEEQIRKVAKWRGLKVKGTGSTGVSRSLGFSK